MMIDDLKYPIPSGDRFKEKYMAELKATPGPWVAVKVGVRITGEAKQPIFGDGRWIVLPEDDTQRTPLAEIDHANDHHPPCRKQAEHDAQLIAAAPELYKALHEMDRWFRKTPGYSGSPIKRRNRAILAKARGQHD